MNRSPASSVSAISAYLLHLHRSSHELSLREFQERAIEGLKTLVDFQSALAAVGTMQRSGPIAHDAFLHGQPPSLMESWERMKHVDLVAAAAIASPGRAHRFVSEEIFAEIPLALEHCRRFSLAHVVCMATIGEREGSLFALSLYRHDPAEPFTEEEQETIELIVPHLVEATRRARIEEIRRSARVTRPLNEAAAIVSRSGVVLEAEAAFVELLTRAYPEWSGPVLPQALMTLASSTTADRQTLGRLVLRVDPQEDLVLVHGRFEHAFDRLTEREREVARLFACGDSTKEIAEKLSIAVNTVRVHLGRVYEKLGVVNKAELASMIAACE